MTRTADNAEGRGAAVRALEQARRELDDAEAVADHLADDAARAAARADEAVQAASAAEREARRLRNEADALGEHAMQVQARADHARRQVAVHIEALRARELELRRFQR